MNTDDLQREARALGDPTRFKIFQYIAEALNPVGVAELTDFVALNHNAVRQHLAVLKSVDLIVEQTEQRAVAGRPRLLYRLHPEVAGKWSTPSPYAWLAGLLSRAIKNNLSPFDVGRAEGVERAGRRNEGDAMETLESELTESGFRPSRSARGRQVTFVLQRCPLADAAAADPVTVCQLHRGLVEGLTEGLKGVQFERLSIKDPYRAGCRLVFGRDAAAHD